MFNVVLYQPEIPPNTGNIVRLCANTGAHLHLIRPLGFEFDDKRLRRAGLDYHEFATVQQHDDIDSYWLDHDKERAFACSTKGSVGHASASFAEGDTLLFGPETRGLPDDVLGGFPMDRILRIPMRPTSRSLNLSNAVAVVVYEAWRQLDYRS